MCVHMCLLELSCSSKLCRPCDPHRCITWSLKDLENAVSSPASAQQAEKGAPCTQPWNGRWGNVCVRLKPASSGTFWWLVKCSVFQVCSAGVWGYVWWRRAELCLNMPFVRPCLRSPMKGVRCAHCVGRSGGGGGGSRLLSKMLEQNEKLMPSPNVSPFP